jgi:hypothetical protein
MIQSTLAGLIETNRSHIVNAALIRLGQHNESRYVVASSGNAVSIDEHVK